MLRKAEDIFEACLESAMNPSNTLEVLECVASGVDDSTRKYARDYLLIYSAALVFFMQGGFAMLCAGSVRLKNVENTMLKNLLDACGAALSFFAVGYGLAFGGDDSNSHITIAGTSNFFLQDVDDYAFWLFQYAFSAASATIVAGTLAERCQMTAYLAYSIALCGCVYPVVAHAVWSSKGVLSPTRFDPLLGVGMVDFAGSGVVHLTGGMTALLAVIILGPRIGRFHDPKTGRLLDEPKEMRGHSLALQMMGTFTLWFGWYGFNSGSALLIDSTDSMDLASLAGVNTTLASGAGGIMAVFGRLFVVKRATGETRFEMKYAMNGSLSGLVAITAGCGVVKPWAAVVIGCIAGLLYMVASWGLVQLRLDDAVDAIPVHMFNGIWGVISVGLFASRDLLEIAFPHAPATHAGWFYDLSDAHLIGAQFVGIVLIMGWILGVMMPFFVFLDWHGWFRVDYSEEIQDQGAPTPSSSSPC